MEIGIIGHGFWPQVGGSVPPPWDGGDLGGSFGADWG